MQSTTNIILLIAGAVAVLLQLLVSPYLNLFGATPNFVFASLIALSLIFTEKPHYVYAFLLGALFDFSQGSTLGAWMLLLVLSSVLVQGFGQNIDSSNVVAQLVLGIVVCITFNVLHMLILIITTPELSFSALISSGVLWSLLLDSITYVIFYVIFRIIYIKFAQKSAFGGYI